MQVHLLLQQNNRLIPGLLELSLSANGFTFFLLQSAGTLLEPILCSDGQAAKPQKQEPQESTLLLM